jgi:hypothetical protein
MPEQKGSACRGAFFDAQYLFGARGNVGVLGSKVSESITLPKGKPLVTLRDAANYITKLPKAEHEAPEWRAAMEGLLLVVEQNGPTMFARIGVMRALKSER